MAPITSEIAAFYRRWHQHESLLGADGQAIIDFDYCPDPIGVDLTPFSSRLEALRSIAEVRGRLAETPRSALRNHELLTLRLHGSELFLRSLIGERFRLDQYLSATLGAAPRPPTEAELDELRQNVESALDAFGLRLREQDRTRYDELTRYPDRNRFGSSLRTHADEWVRRIRSTLNLDAPVNYHVEEAEADAYWMNWIDGRRGEPIRLRINLHPRSDFRRGSDVSLAVHEIGGHAVQIAELEHSRSAGRIDDAALSTTVHSCELFQMEGVAQTTLHLILEDGETLPADVACHEAISAYHLALLQHGHHAMEDGVPSEDVVERIAMRAPFLEVTRILADLRDRTRHPLYRCLMYVYHQSRMKFLEARSLPRPKRLAFLERMYRSLWTPTQIDRFLDELRTP